MKKVRYPYEFDPKKRKLADRYRIGRLVSFLFNGIVIPLGFLYLFVLSGAAARMSDAFLVFGYLKTPIYIFVVLWFLTVVEFPLQFYFSYMREHKYGLSNYTLGGWFKDYLKGLFLGYLIEIPLLVAFLYLLGFNFWWVYASIAFMLFHALLTYILPVVVLPFFYKLSPYGDKVHNRKMLEIVRKAGAKNIKNIFVANESTKSSRANAFFAGFGKTKRIVLFDTLTKNFTRDEVETVIGHELGHYVNRDELREMLLQAILIFPTLFIIDVVLRSSVGSFGIYSLSSTVIIPLFLLAYTILGLLVMPIENTYSRKLEREADLFALTWIKKPDPQISAEKRLADMALSELKDHPFIEFFLNGHPNTIDRIEFCKRWKKTRRRRK